MKYSTTVYRCVFRCPVNTGKRKNQYSNRRKYDIITDILNSNCIDHCIVKGSEVASLYPIPLLRSMGDTDIIIKEVDRIRTHKILLEHNYSFVRSSEDEWEYTKNGIVFEIHDSMIHHHKGNEKILKYFNNLWNYGSYNKYHLTLNWDFHFMYLIQHISGHFLITGIGIRQFYDLAIVLNTKSFDWDFIKRELSRLNLRV